MRRTICLLSLLALMGCQTKPAAPDGTIGFHFRPVRSQQVEAVFPDAPPPSKPQ